MSSKNLEGLIRGLHHITLVTSNETINRRFYTEVLGLRRVKLSVNQDDILHRHLFYADEKGTTGTAITFFEWPDLPHGRAGLSSPHHLAYSVRNVDALARWIPWLGSNRVSPVGPVIRDGRASIYFKDPDGVTIEITSPSGERATIEYIRSSAASAPVPSVVSGDMRLTTFHHASPITSDPSLTGRFFEKFLGLHSSPNLSNQDEAGTQITPIGNADAPNFLRYLGSPRAEEGSVGIGSIHHIAMAVEEDEEQSRIMRHLNEVGVRNSGIIDRSWFKSLYFRDPDGNLLEIATKKPGYTVDEPLEKLGTKLVFPHWLEPQRSKIEMALAQTDKANESASWPPKYPRMDVPPEMISLHRENRVDAG